MGHFLLINQRQSIQAEYNLFTNTFLQVTIAVILFGFRA